MDDSEEIVNDDPEAYKWENEEELAAEEDAQIEESKEKYYELDYTQQNFIDSIKSNLTINDTILFESNSCIIMEEGMVEISEDTAEILGVNEDEALYCFCGAGGANYRLVVSYAATNEVKIYNACQELYTIKNKCLYLDDEYYVDDFYISYDNCNTGENLFYLRYGNPHYANGEPAE